MLPNAFVDEMPPALKQLMARDVQVPLALSNLAARDQVSAAHIHITRHLSLGGDRVTDLAQRAGMSFQTVGGRPGVPLLVTVDVYQKPLIEVLHDLGLQAGRRADLAVNRSNNTIEIRYAPVDRT